MGEKKSTADRRLILFEKQTFTDVSTKLETKSDGRGSKDRTYRKIVTLTLRISDLRGTRRFTKYKYIANLVQRAGIHAQTDLAPLSMVVATLLFALPLAFAQSLGASSVNQQV